jgi:hypothetical protein
MRGRLVGLLVSFLLAGAVLGVPAQAGTEAAPEITDPANDQVLTGADQTNCFPTVNCITGTQIDITAVWFSQEGANLIISVKVSSAPTSTPQYNKYWDVSFKAGTAAVTAGAVIVGSGSLTATGAATAVVLEETVLVLTVPLTALGGAELLTEPFATAAYAITQVDERFISDRAPDDTAFGTAYSLGSGNETGGLPGDQDADGLQDTFEQQYFGNATSPETGSGDPDSDSLNNTREQELGTDPTKADTDGDGVKDGQEATDGTDPTKADTDGDGANDGAEKAAGTDPKDPASKPSTQTSTTTTSGTTTSATTSTTTSTTTAGAEEDVDVAYLGASVAAAVVLTILGLIAIFGRWGA